MKNFYISLLSILLLVSIGFKPVHGQTLEADSLALVALYNDCNGTNWVGFDTWLIGPISTWEAVTVKWVKNEAGTDSTQRVTAIVFQNMTLTGTLPDALGNLTEMAGTIVMRDQLGLTGTFPSFFWNWTKVTRMQIKFCGFDSLDVTGIDKMVNLYEINTQGTPFKGEVPVEIFELPLMRDVYLEDGNWSSLPAGLPIPTPTPLRRFYINGNQFTELPDLTGMIWAAGTNIKIRNNYLTFEDIEPNMWIASDANVSAFEYSPQALLTEKDTITVEIGQPVSMSVICGGSQNIYTWFKNGDIVTGADQNTLAIASALSEDEGNYQCIVQSTLVAGLDIASDTFKVVVNLTNILETTENVFRLNGNPVSDLLSIDSNTRIESLNITDITGRVFMNSDINSNSVRLNVNNLKQGVYFITLKTISSKTILKIVKQ